MKRIIDGKLYDTETATCIADWDNGYPYNDFNWYREILYRTRNGRYFVYIEGGPLSPASRTIGNNSVGGNTLYTLTDNEAYEWLCGRGFTDEACELFPGLVKEG